MTMNAFALTCLGLLTFALSTVTEILVAIYINQPLLWVALIMKLPVGVVLASISTQYKNEFMTMVIKKEIGDKIDKVTAKI